MSISRKQKAAIEALLTKQQSEFRELLGIKSIRLNLMIPGEDGALRIAAHTDGFGQEELKVWFYEDEGCAGKAWKEKQTMFADLTEQVKPVEEWKVRPEVQELVSSDLKAIVSIPVFTSGRKQGGEENVIGVLNVDSLEDISALLAGLDRIVYERLALLVQKEMEE